MKVSPIGNYLLLKKYTKPAQKGSLIIPNGKNYDQWGVYQSHDSTIESTKNYKIGDILQVKPYAKQPVDDSDDLFLVKEEDVVARIEL